MQQIVKDSGSYYQFQVHTPYNHRVICSNALYWVVMENIIKTLLVVRIQMTQPPPTSGNQMGAGYSTLDAMQAGLGNGVIKKYTTTNWNATARTDLWDDVAVDLSNTAHAQLSTYWQDATDVTRERLTGSLIQI